MTSVTLKFRASTIKDNKGSLYFQLIHNRHTRQISTEFHIFSWEWDEKRNRLIEYDKNYSRCNVLSSIQRELKFEYSQINEIINQLEDKGVCYTTNDVISAFFNLKSDKQLIFAFIRKQIDRLRQLGKLSTASNTLSMLRSFMRFRNNKDLSFDMLSADMIELYEAHLKERGNTRNTTSFYLRIFRSIYRKAIDEGVTDEINLFKNVYTGVDKTVKRAIPQKEFKRIMELDLTNYPKLVLARDLFLFSFYTRGMSFIDLAFLRKKDLVSGMIVYHRSKTTQEINIQWEKPMQVIVDKYDNHETQYLLPIITKEDGTEYKQYKNALMLINQKLKKIGKLAKVSQPISMYTARHEWASIAREMNIPLSIISEGLGHDNDKNTQIYLASIRTEDVDKANKKIIAKMWGKNKKDIL